MTGHNKKADRRSLIDAAWTLHRSGKRPTLTLLQLQFDQHPIAQLEAALQDWQDEFDADAPLPAVPSNWQDLGPRLYAELAPAIRAQVHAEAENQIQALQAELRALRQQDRGTAAPKPPSTAPVAPENLNVAADAAADAEITSLQRQLRDAQTRAARDVAATELARTNLDLAENRIADLERQAKEAQQRYTRALAEHSARVDALSAEHKKAQLDLRTELNREHQQRMQQEIERRQNEQRKLSAEITAQQRRLGELEADAESQRIDNARLNAELAATKRENAKLQERIGELSADLENTQNLLKDARRGR